MIDTHRRGCKLIEKLIDLNTNRVFKVTFHALDSFQNIKIFIFLLELKERLNFDDRFKNSLNFSLVFSFISSSDIAILKEVSNLLMECEKRICVKFFDLLLFVLTLAHHFYSFSKFFIMLADESNIRP